MDDNHARDLLAAERSRLEALLARTEADGRSERDQAERPGDMSDPAERLTAEEADDAIAAGLRTHLEAVERAEGRLAAGTYGTSMRSGKAIPDERLEADPTAELTVEEAAEEGSALG